VGGYFFAFTFAATWHSKTSFKKIGLKGHWH
jgi:hypothetical protein